MAPNRLLLLPVALLLALATGAFASFAAGQMRPVFFDGQSVRELTGMPYLGRVSYISDAKSDKEHKFKSRLFFGLLSALVGIYCVGLLILFLRSSVAG